MYVPFITNKAKKCLSVSKIIYIKKRSNTCLEKEKITLKATITTAADDIYKYFSLFFGQNKT